MDRRFLSPLGLVGAALAVRSAGALLRPPWHDEYFTVFLARQSFPDLLASLRLDSGPPLPYLLTKLLTLIGLAPLAAGRLVSVAAGTLSVYLAWKAAVVAIGQRQALFLASLLLVHPLALAFSSEGRAYALVLLATAWAWERLEAIRSQGRGTGGLAAAVGLACWSHGLGPALAGAVALASFTLPAPARRRCLAGVAAGLFSFLPWLPLALRQPAAATAWMSDAWRALPPVERIAAPLRLLPPLAPFGRSMDLPTFPAALTLLAAGGCAVLLARSRPPAHLLLLATVPTLGLPLLATLGAPAYYPGRAEALFLVPALALCAAGSGGGRLGSAVAAALVVAAALATASVLQTWRAAPPPFETLFAATIRTQRPAGALVVASGHWWLDLSQALEGSGTTYPVLAYPRCVARHPGWYDPPTCLPTAQEREELFALLAAAPSVALLVAPHLPVTAQLEAMAARLSLLPVLTTPAATLYLSAPVTAPHPATPSPSR